LSRPKLEIHCLVLVKHRALPCLDKLSPVYITGLYIKVWWITQQTSKHFRASQLSVSLLKHIKGCIQHIYKIYYRWTS